MTIPRTLFNRRTLPRIGRKIPAIALANDELRLTRTDTSSRRIAQLPKSLGFSVMLAGAVTGMLPPFPGPEDALIVAFGALAMWREAFRACESWTHRRFPETHRVSTNIILRYLDDLEKRYPGTIGADVFLAESSDNTDAHRRNGRATTYMCGT
jgi:hypothetical protein